MPNCPIHGPCCNCPLAHAEEQRRIEQRNLTIYDMPLSKLQVHIHSDESGTEISGATLKAYGVEEPLKKLNGYEGAMLDFFAQQAGIKRKDEKSK